MKHISAYITIRAGFHRKPKGFGVPKSRNEEQCRRQFDKGSQSADTTEHDENLEDRADGSTKSCCVNQHDRGGWLSQERMLFLGGIGVR